MSSNLRCLQIPPIDQSVRQFLPLILLLSNTRPAFRIVFSNPVLFYLSPAFKPQLLLYFNFNRQSVRIPAPFTLHPVSFQCFIPAKEIFYRPGHHMVNTRLTVRCGRAFEESKRNTIVSRLQAPLKDPVLFPPVQYLYFSFWILVLYNFVKLFSYYERYRSFTLKLIETYNIRKGSQSMYLSKICFS